MYNWLNFIDYINTILIHIQPLRGWHVGGTFSTGCTKAIISRSELLRFAFTPIGVEALVAHFPQVPPVAIHIQPLSGLARLSPFAKNRFR